MEGDISKDIGSARLLIADDDARARLHLRAMFEAVPDFEVAAEAGDGREATNLARELLPDLVLMDVRMPRMDGIEATGRIKHEHPETTVLILTAFEDPDYLRAALESGAAGYVLKHADPEDILTAARGALSGGLPLDASLSSRLLKDLVDERHARKTKDMPDTRAGAVRVWLLGGFSVSVGERVVEGDEWRLRKAASLIKLLALARGHSLHRERITDALWPDLDAKSQTNNLHRALHFARHALGDGPDAPRFLTLENSMLSLYPDGSLWADFEAFENASANARRTREPSAYRAAVELYSGDLLPEDRFEGWAEERRGELRAKHLALLVEMAALHEERGESARAVEALREAVAREHAHEEAHLGLMRLYAATGRRREALLQYERLRKVLSEDLDAAPGADSERLYEEILAGRFPRSRPVSRPPEEGIAARHNLPVSLTSFVGREREALEIKRLLAMSRLLTLTGAGGSGKTRLAVEVARDLAGACPDGAWLVELAPLSEGAPQAAARALGVREQPGRSLTDALAEHLRTKDLLLVLDNCEHLVDAAARMANALLGACPKLRILATSREPLDIPGEAVRPVPPLSLPDGDGTSSDIEVSMRSEAVRLFVERARSRLPDFELTEENAGAVMRVCEKLDGIPLAIELAAARMGALAVEQVAERLEDSLGLLTGGGRTTEPRHRTMRATLAWSHDLLEEPERVLFRRLSVFAGDWTLEAAEEVCSGGGTERGEILDLLSRLVDKSLATFEARGGSAPRYTMLEPVRQYALEKLEESGEMERVRDGHARHYLSLAEAAEPELAGAGQIAWLERLAAEYANLRAALSRFLDDDNEGAPEESARMGLRLAAALGRFWGVRGASEGREWMEKGLAKSVSPPESLRAKALREAGFIAVYHLDPRAMEMLEEALALSEEIGDKAGQAISINYLMHAIGILGRHERMPTLREETEALLAEPPENRRAAAYLSLSLGMMGMVGRDHGHVSRIEEALALFREEGDLRTCAICLTILGMAAMGRDDAGEAARAFDDALRLLRRLKDKIGAFYSLTGAAGVAALRDRPIRAARLFGAAEALRKAIGHPAQPLKRVNYDYETHLAATRAELGDAAFEAAFSEGQAMSPEQAIEYALTREGKSGKLSVERPVLTDREEEVAALVARGLTNRRIAEELSISARTADTHVGRILKKLGLRSRGQVADYVERRRHEVG